MKTLNIVHMFTYSHDGKILKNATYQWKFKMEFNYDVLTYYNLDYSHWRCKCGDLNQLHSHTANECGTLVLERSGGCKDKQKFHSEPKSLNWDLKMCRAQIWKMWVREWIEDKSAENFHFGESWLVTFIMCFILIRWIKHLFHPMEKQILNCT